MVQPQILWGFLLCNPQISWQSSDLTVDLSKSSSRSGDYFIYFVWVSVWQWIIEVAFYTISPLTDWDLQMVFNWKLNFHEHRSEYRLDLDAGLSVSDLFFIGLSYIYKRPMLVNHLNLKRFKFGKCVHFMQIRWKCMHFQENACILCKLDENVCIFRKMCTFYAN